MQNWYVSDYRLIPGRTFVICQPKFSGSPYHQDDPQPIHTNSPPSRFSKSCNLVLMLAIDSFCSQAPYVTRHVDAQVESANSQGLVLLALPRFDTRFNSTPGLLLVSGKHFISFSFERAAQNWWRRSVQFSLLGLQKSPLLIRHSKSVSRILITVAIYPKAPSVRLALLSMTLQEENTNSS